MTFYTDDRAHPLGLVNNPEWDVVLTRRADLYIAERARRSNPEREPNHFGLAVGIISVLVVALGLVGSVV